MKQLFIVVSFLFFALGNLYAQETTYAYHIVQKGETLYRISANNKLSLSELKVLNPHIVGNNIKPGDFLKLPYRGLTPTPPPMPSTRPPLPTIPLPPSINSGSTVVIIDGVLRNIEDADQAIQEVSPVPAPILSAPSPSTTLPPSTTLSPSVSIDDLRPYKHIVQKGETLFSVAKHYNQSLKALRNWNLLDGNAIKLGLNLIVGWYFPEDQPASPDPVKMSPSERKFYHKSQNKAKYKQVQNKGIATIFEDGGAANSLYALHKTAPPYSIVKVVNPTNQATVYVKVLGKLPNEVGNENVLIKLTSSAAKKLDLLDKRTMLEVHHHVKRR